MSTIKSFQIRGVQAVPIEVTARDGRAAAHGLKPDAARELIVRVRSALTQSGFENAPLPELILAPAGRPSSGAACLDLPAALAVLVHRGHLAPEEVEGVAAVGELGLDGRLRPVRGGFCHGRAAAGLRALVLPLASLDEAAAGARVEGHDVALLGAADLDEAVKLLRCLRAGFEAHVPEQLSSRPRPEPPGSILDVRGQDEAKQALVSAAARVNRGESAQERILLVGPPGSGKTMLARRAVGLLAPRGDAWAEIASIHSAAGLRVPDEDEALPFRAPHHTVSTAGLLGGGPGPNPGEVSLAHGGVLFLDELPEFRPDALEALAGALRDGEARISRRGEPPISMPARPRLVVAAASPCPCGRYGEARATHPCTCGEAAVERYRARAEGFMHALGFRTVRMHAALPA